jgi:hypothetical protein
MTKLRPNQGSTQGRNFFTFNTRRFNRPSISGSKYLPRQNYIVQQERHKIDLGTTGLPDHSRNITHKTEVISREEILSRTEIKNETCKITQLETHKDSLKKTNKLKGPQLRNIFTRDNRLYIQLATEIQEIIEKYF